MLYILYILFSLSFFLFFIFIFIFLQWNYNICEKYFSSDERASHYFVPVINGFIQQYPNVNIDGELCDITLISRRSEYHAGVRYLTRGLNDQKNPANFVETEQIVVRPNGITNSFVMVYINTSFHHLI